MSELKPTWGPAPDVSELDNIVVPEMPDYPAAASAAEPAPAEEPAEVPAAESAPEPTVEAPAEVSAAEPAVEVSAEAPSAEPAAEIVAPPVMAEEPAEVPAVPAEEPKSDKAERKAREADDAVKAAKAAYVEASAVAAQVQSTVGQAVTDEKAALDAVRKAEKKRLHAWKKTARKKAAEFLEEKKNADEVARAALEAKRKAEVKAWRKSLRGLDKQEKKDQKTAYKKFCRRLNRTRRIIIWLIIIALVAAFVLASIFIPSLNRVVTGWLDAAKALPHKLLPWI